MGIFCCCFRPKVFQSERKHILEDKKARNEVFNGNPSEIIPSINYHLFGKQIVDLSEQTLFDLTVQQMEAKMVNIPALKSQISDVGCSKDRQRLYDTSIQRIKTRVRNKSDEEKPRHKKDIAHHKHLSVNERCSKMERISGQDIKLINKYSEKSSIAVNKGFGFWSDEPFVIEFDPNRN